MSVSAQRQQKHSGSRSTAAAEAERQQKQSGSRSRAAAEAERQRVVRERE